MAAEPYASAARVFLIVDNGTVRRGRRAARRLQGAWANVEAVHRPVHASWLNQIEIYFSILACKALTPGHFADTDELASGSQGSRASSSARPGPSTGPSPAVTCTRSLSASTSAVGSRRPPDRTSREPVLVGAGAALLVAVDWRDRGVQVDHQARRPGPGALRRDAGVRRPRRPAGAIVPCAWQPESMGFLIGCPLPRRGAEIPHEHTRGPQAAHGG